MRYATLCAGLPPLAKCLLIKSVDYFAYKNVKVLGAYKPSEVLGLVGYVLSRRKLNLSAYNLVVY